MRFLKKYWVLAMMFLVSACGRVVGPEEYLTPSIESTVAEVGTDRINIVCVLSGRDQIKEYGVYWGTEESQMTRQKGGIWNSEKETSDILGGDFSNSISFTSEINGLTPATNYLYKVFISNGRSEITSGIVSFRTEEEKPVVPDTLTIPDVIKISDANFESYLLRHFDANNDGQLSKDEAWNIKKIDIESTEINSLNGVEYFSNLTSLRCSGDGTIGHLTKIDLSWNQKLEYLDLSYNEITSIDLSKNQELSYLDLSHNSLNAIDLTENTKIETLLLDSNGLASLDVSNLTNLVTLFCADNQLTELDLSANTALTSLTAYGNLITSLDLTSNTSLYTVKLNPMDTLTELHLVRGQNYDLSIPDATSVYYKKN